MTEDGIAIEPLYAPGGPGDADARNLAGRVVGLLPLPDFKYRIRQRLPVTSPRDVLDAAVTGGIQSLELTWSGTDELPLVLGMLHELGRAGIETSLEGSDLASLTALSTGLTANGAYSLGIDPVSSFFLRDGISGEPKHELDMSGVSRVLAPRCRALRATGDPFFNAGATTGMTLGVTVAIALAYLRALEAAGADLFDAAHGIEIRLPCGPRFFESAAMLRAGRIVWARVLDLAGIEGAPMTLVAITGRRALTRHDPWNNALRNTSVAFAAAIGGADVLHLLPHDVRAVTPGAAGLRLARTTGLVLKEEASLGRVLDPAEGSWFLESLTSELAAEAWDELRRLEAAGGIIAALESGDLSRRIAAAAAARHERVRERRHAIVGVTEHPVEGELVPASPAEIAETARHGAFPLRPDALPYEALRDAGER